MRVNWAITLCGPYYRSKLVSRSSSKDSRTVWMRSRARWGYSVKTFLENFPVESQCRRLHFRGLLSYKRRVLQVYSNRNLHHQNHRIQILLHFRLFRFKKNIFAKKYNAYMYLTIFWRKIDPKYQKMGQIRVKISSNQSKISAWTNDQNKMYSITVLPIQDFAVRVPVYTV